MTGSTSTDMMMMRPKDQAMLKAMPGNDRCIDCGRISPEWASVTLSVFVCLECSGQHRGLGTHISFIRSVKMDSWTPKQIEAMKAGGNDKCKEFLATKGMIDMTIMSPYSIKQKYESPAAELWRQVIKARVNGTEEPTELPEFPEITSVDSQAGSEHSNSSPKKKFGSLRGGRKTGGSVGAPVKVMEGFGSSPHPSELKKSRKKRAKKILGAGAAAIGAIAAVGMAARNRKKAAATSIALSKRV